MSSGVYGLLTQGMITGGVLGSAWLSNRVWKGVRRNGETRSDPPSTRPVALNDPTTPEGMLIQRLDTENRSLAQQLDEARKQVVQYVENNARLKAEKTAAEAQLTALERRNLELEAQIAARARR